MKFTTAIAAAIMAFSATATALPTEAVTASTPAAPDSVTNGAAYLPAEHGPNPDPWFGLPLKEGFIRWHPGPNAPEKRDPWFGLPLKEGFIRWHPGPSAPEKRDVAEEKRDPWFGLPLKEGFIRWHPGPSAPEKRDPWFGLPLKEGFIRWHPGPNNNQKRDVSDTEGMPVTTATTTDDDSETGYFEFVNPE